MCVTLRGMGRSLERPLEYPTLCVQWRNIDVSMRMRHGWGGTLTAGLRLAALEVAESLRAANTVSSLPSTERPIQSSSTRFNVGEVSSVSGQVSRYSDGLRGCMARSLIPCRGNRFFSSPQGPERPPSLLSKGTGDSFPTAKAAKE